MSLVKIMPENQQLNDFTLTFSNGIVGSLDYLNSIKGITK